MKSLENHKLLGIRVNAIDLDMLSEIVENCIVNSNKIVLGYQNLHGIYVYHHNKKMREFYSLADYIIIDGMPIIYMGKFLGKKFERKHRLVALDWLYPILNQSEKKEWKIFYLGSKPLINKRGKSILYTSYPNLKLETHHGYFSHNENQKILDQINSFSPDILLVGMGMPKQEIWIAQNIEKLSVKVTITTGAFIDYVAGAIYKPPRWMGRCGLEWLHRLIGDPIKLLTRYLLEPCFVIVLFLNNLIKKN